ESQGGLVVAAAAGDTGGGDVVGVVDAVLETADGGARGLDQEPVAVGEAGRIIDRHRDTTEVQPSVIVQGQADLSTGVAPSHLEVLACRIVTHVVVGRGQVVHGRGVERGAHARAAGIVGVAEDPRRTRREHVAAGVAVVVQSGAVHGVDAL